MTVRLSWAIAVIVLCCFGTAAACIVYARQVAEDSERRAEQARIESDRKWCNLFATMDRAYDVGPGPTTETGRAVAQGIHQLRVAPQPIGFGCPD